MVKLVVTVVVVEGHSGERRKRETMVKKEKKLGGKLIFYRIWPLISSSSGHEIHIYL